jgi:hypothetical protein
MKISELPQVSLFEAFQKLNALREKRASIETAEDREIFECMLDDALSEVECAPTAGGVH